MCPTLLDIEKYHDFIYRWRPWGVYDKSWYYFSAKNQSQICKIDCWYWELASKRDFYSTDCSLHIDNILTKMKLTQFTYILLCSSIALTSFSLKYTGLFKNYVSRNNVVYTEYNDSLFYTQILSSKISENFLKNFLKTSTSS